MMVVVVKLSRRETEMKLESFSAQFLLDSVQEASD